MKTYRWKTVLILSILVVLATSSWVLADSPYFDVEELPLPGGGGFGYGYGLLPLFEFPMGNGDLYVGAPNVGEGVAVWKRDESIAEGWRRVDGRGLNGNPGNFSIIDYFLFNGHTYMSVWSSDWDGCKDNDPDTDTWGLLFRVESVDPPVFHRVDPPGGFGGYCVMGQTVHRHTDPRDGQEREFLYVGITTLNTEPGAKIYRIPKEGKNVPIEPGSWELVQTNFDASVTDVSALCVYKDELYAGLEDHTRGARVWKYVDHARWEPVSGYGFGTIRASGAGDKNKNAFWLLVHQGRLYCQTWNDAGSELLRYEGGRTWALVKKHVGAYGGGLALIRGTMLTFGSNDKAYYYYPELDRFVQIILPPCLKGIGSVVEYQGKLMISTTDFYRNPAQSVLYLGGHIHSVPHGGIWIGEESVIDSETVENMLPCCGSMPGLPSGKCALSYVLVLLFPLVGLAVVRRSVKRRPAFHSGQRISSQAVSFQIPSSVV